MKGAFSEQKSGLRFGAKPVEKTSSSAVERQAVINAVEAQEEERRILKNHSLEHFAEWAKWDECILHHESKIVTGRS